MAKEKESVQQGVFRFIEEKTGENKVLAIPQTFLRFCGDLESAAFLSQLLFRCDKGKRPDGFIWKSYSEWTSETGLSKHQVRQIVNKLKASGLLKTKLRHANGTPVIHYKLDQKAFITAIDKFLTMESEKINYAKLKNSLPITETTTEKTYREEKDNGTNPGGVRPVPLSFKQYFNKYEVDQEIADGIEYFLQRYRKVMREKHPNLRPEQWRDGIYNLSEYGSHIEELVNQYFQTSFAQGTDYRFPHFTSPEILQNRIYDAGLY